MPFEIRKVGPPSKPYCVFTVDTDHNHGCHPTREEAMAQQRALYHAVPEASKGEMFLHFGAAVKAMGEGKVGGYLVQFGEDATKDADQEWFTPLTDFDTEFPARASIYYNHGLDPVVGRRRLGHGTMKTDDLGVWVEAQLDLHDRYQAAMYRMAQGGKLGWSSGSLSHLTDPPREAPGGPVKHWPLGHDASLTPMPSDRRNLAIALKSWVAEGPAPLEELAEVSYGSLAENTDRWTDTGMEVLSGYQSIAAKAGRKLSASRRARLMEMRQMIDDLLSETAPRDEAPEEEERTATLAPGTGDGEEDWAMTIGATTAPSRIAVPDLSNLCAALSRQDDRRGGAPTAPEGA